MENPGDAERPSGLSWRKLLEAIWSLQMSLEVPRSLREANLKVADQKIIITGVKKVIKLRKPRTSKV